MHNNSGAVVEVRKVMKVSPSTQPIQAHALTLLEPRTPRRRARRPAIGLPRVPNPVHAPPWSSQKDSLSSLLSPWKNEQRRGTRGETVAVVAEMVTLTPNPVTCTSLWRHRRRGRRGVSHTGTYPVEAVHGGSSTFRKTFTFLTFITFLNNLQRLTHLTCNSLLLRFERSC